MTTPCCPEFESAVGPGGVVVETHRRGCPGVGREGRDVTPTMPADIFAELDATPGRCPTCGVGLDEPVADDNCPVPEQHVSVWTLFTGGPVLELTADLAGMRAHVEQHAPLKRGWSGRWIVIDDDRHVYRRSNSKGRDIESYDIRVRRGALPRPA